MFSTYTSPRIYLETTTPLKLKNVIPANSTILSVIIQVFNTATGTVTLQTEAKDSELGRRIIYLDGITASGIYSGDSAKDYFISNQNVFVKITGSLEIEFKLLFWEVNE